MKTALYRNPSYCLSFGDDCIFLDVEVAITREHEQRSDFFAVVNRAQLVPGQQDFAIYLLNYLSAEKLQVFKDDLHSRLLVELKPQLFSLFYSSEIIPPTNETIA